MAADNHESSFQILGYLQRLQTSLNQLQDQTRINGLNIARLEREYFSNTASIKTLLHVLNNRIENIFINPPTSKKYRTGSDNLFRSKTATKDRDEDIGRIENVHRECLQENFEYVVQELMVHGTNLIDDLEVDSCLTEGEASDIKYHHRDSKTQIRKLMLAIYSRDRNVFEKFREILKKDNKHVYDKLTETYKKKIQEGPKLSETHCVVCVIKREVDIRHVIDKLCSHFIIDPDYVNTILSYSDRNHPRVRTDFWNCVFSNIDESPDRTDKVKLLQHALSESKYKNLSDKLASWSLPKLSCKCRENLQLSFTSICSDSMSTSTAGDLSTTSDFRIMEQIRSTQSISSVDDEPSRDCHGNLPYTLEWVNSSPPTATSDPRQPWTYPDAYSDMPTSVVDDRSQQKTPNSSKIKTMPMLKSLPERLNKRAPANDTSTDGLESPLLQTTSKVVDANRFVTDQLVECHPPLLPDVDPYTGRRKVYTKKRHRRVRSDESGSIKLDNYYRRSSENDRLRQIDGLVDNPEKRISDLFYKNLKDNLLDNHKTHSDHPSHPLASVTESTGTFSKQENHCEKTIDTSETDTGLAASLNGLSLDNIRIPQNLQENVGIERKSPDSNNNPKFVTDQVIITPSKHVDPLSSGVGTRSLEYTKSKKRRRKEKRTRLETC